MWWRCLSWCGVALGAVASLSADMRESAWRARAKLGPDRWAQVLRIELAKPGDATPKVIHALVFELEERLWYYAADHGTESLSIRRGRLAQDKADLGPLLRNIEPRFMRYEILDEEPGAAFMPGGEASLPEGCFIECVAYLQAMIAAGRIPDAARILAYYGEVNTIRRGHTVLYFEQAGQRFYFDPDRPSVPVPISEHVGTEALAIAQVASPASGYAPPVRAVFLPLRVLPPVGPGWPGREVVAGGPSARDRDPTAPVLMN